MILRNLDVHHWGAEVIRNHCWWCRLSVATFSTMGLSIKPIGELFLCIPATFDWTKHHIAFGAIGPNIPKSAQHKPFWATYQMQICGFARTVCWLRCHNPFWFVHVFSTYLLNDSFVLHVSFYYQNVHCILGPHSCEPWGQTIQKAWMVPGAQPFLKYALCALGI